MSGERPRLLVVGGPDVDQRLPLLERLAHRFDGGGVGSRPELAHRFAERGFPYAHYRLSRGFNLLADARSVLELRRIFRRLRPRLVHCFDTKPCVVGRLAAAAAGVPVVVGTLPGLGALYTYDTPAVHRRRAVFRRLHRWSSHRSDATVFQNRDDLERFVGDGVVPADRAHLIPGSGVATEPFDRPRDADREALRARLGLPADAFVVLQVARLIRAKGILHLGRAAELLRRDGDGRCRVLLVGPRDPETLDAVSDAELAELRGRVRWLGERDDVPDLLAAANLFAFPSHYREGIPRVLVEAALAGVPAVAADNVGSREVVVDGETGLLVPPHRPDLLAEAIRRLRHHPDLARRLADAARRRARGRFTLGPIAERHRELYERLLASKRGEAGR